MLRKISDALGETPLDTINLLAETTNSPEAYPPITLPPEVQKIRQGLKPQSLTLFKHTPTDARVTRGLMMNSPGEISNAQRRSAFKFSQTSALQDPDLSSALNAISNYESAGSGGYNAVNQGGEDGGTKIPEGFYSGDFRDMPQHGGRAFTDLNIGEVMDLQYDPGKSKMSDAEWVKAGKLHAVSRYQIIGSTLKGLVQRHNIPRTAKFTPRLQDLLGLSLLKSGGPGQWVGLRKASEEDMNIILKAEAKMKAMPWEELNSMIQAELANT